MKQQIENIIKKNLPEKREEKGTGIYKDMLGVEEMGFNQALSQINPSLIADEVLKVVVETYREAIEFSIDTINEEGHYCIRPGAKEGILKLVDYKLNK